MASDPAIGESMSLFQRAKAILLRPKEAWTAIARDHTPSGELFTRYAIPLAAIGPVCLFFGSQIFGGGQGLFGGAFSAVASYAVSLVNLLAMSFAASKLAERFGGEASPRNAFKLIAYSSTAAWLAGIFVLVPGLSLLGFLAFYSFYLFYEGIGPMMKVPEVNKRRFAGITIVSAILLNLATNALIGSPAWHWGRGANWQANHAPAVRIDRDSRINIGPGELRDIAREIGEAVRKGKVKALPPTDLEALLPADIGSFHRTGMDSANDGPGGSHAEGTYEADDKEFTLKVLDLASFGGMAQIALTFDNGKNHEDADGFERVITKDGVVTIEKWDRDDADGSYATLVGKRYLIEAEGEAESIDALKAAVASIDQSKLTGLGE